MRIDVTTDNCRRHGPHPLQHKGDVWSIQARLPQLRVRTFRASPNTSPPLSPTSPEKFLPRRRSSKENESLATATRAQLREGATGVEDVLNRVRYDLLESKEMSNFQILVDNVERPELCRPHLLRGDCRYGHNCRYQHVTPLRWLSGWAVPLVSNGSHVPFVETLETGKFFHLLDSAPSATARHALLQTVAFVLHKGEVVWCRHVGKTAAQQLWDSFLSVHGALSGNGVHLPSTNAAELMMDWPGNVWERVLQHLQDPCIISGTAVAILCSCRSMYKSSTLGEKKLWQMLANSATDWPSLPAMEEPLQGFTKMAQQVKLYRLCWAACQSSPQKLSLPKQGPCLSPEQAMLDTPGSPKTEARRFHGPTLHVEVGFEVTALRGNAQLTVAASRRSNELRLFQSRGLGRLPTLRLDRRVDALDLVSENDVLVAGLRSVDGQLSIHALSDPKTSTRLTRYKAQAARETTGSHLFAGLHFLPGSGGTQVLAAARSQKCAQLLDVTTADIVVESERLGHSGLVACEVLDHQSSLLVSADGLVRLWDLRSPSLLKVADLEGGYSYDESQMVVSVNVGGPFGCALLSGRALRWADLRAMQMTEVRPATLWPGLFAQAEGGLQAPVRRVWLWLVMA
eukprot:s526_g17.t1